MIGKIIIDKPKLCECVIQIDGIINRIKGKEIEIPYGIHNINVGISYDEYPESSKVHESFTWAWESPREIETDKDVIKIVIKRKWHLLSPVTAEATVSKFSK